MRLEGKSALVSGAAGGIGEAIARLFAREGARVVIGDIADAAGQIVADEITAGGGTACYASLDVTREADWQRVVALAISRHGALHILVNNAGISVPGKLESMALEDWNRVMDVNATGTFLGTRAAIPALRAAGGGVIINMSSSLGVVGADYPSPQYQASKGAVRLLTKNTAIAYAADGIRANSVHPGPIATARTAAVRANPETHARMVSRIPLGRFGEPDEVAYAVLYLASDEARFVTGAELAVDGGWTAQ